MAKGAPPVRIDVVTVVASGASAIFLISVGKILALRFHQHPLAQAFNVLF